MAAKLKPKKYLILDCFTRVTQPYDSLARFKKNATGLLLEHIERANPVLPEGAILELGCGTGQMSAESARILLSRKIVFSDIAPDMVEMCQNKLSGGLRPTDALLFKVMDAEQLTEQSAYAAVLSGLTVQWFNNFHGTLQHIYASLVPGGKFIFSCLVRGSFAEWFSACSKIAVPCTANTLPESQKIYYEVSCVFDSLHSVSETIEVEYPGAAYFFRSLKETGTNVQIDGRMLTAGQMRQLIQSWDRSLNGEKLTMSYVVDIIVAEKKL